MLSAYNPHEKLWTMEKGLLQRVRSDIKNGFACKKTIGSVIEYVAKR